MIKENVGFYDKVVRVVIGSTTLYFSHKFEGWEQKGLLGVTGVMFFTSVFSFCPLYTLFGVNTKCCKKHIGECKGCECKNGECHCKKTEETKKE